MGNPAKRPVSATANATQVARHFGVTPQHVGRLTKEGVISLGSNGRYDLDAARLAYLKYLRARKSTKSDNDTEFRKLKSRELSLRIAKQEGSLIDLEECVVLAEGLVGTFRASLASLPFTVTSDVVLRNRIDEACDHILSQLANEFERKAAALKEGQSLIDPDPVEEVAYEDE